jgi:hypothetical protein
VEYERSTLKTVKRVGQKTFQVEMKNKEDMITPCSPPFDVDDLSADFKHVPLPLFSRIRCVSIDDGGTMFCSCCKFESRGYFCADQVSVAETVHAAKGVQFLGFTHNDIAPRYCTHYMYLAYKVTTPKYIKMSLHQLAMEDIQGPTLTIDIDPSILIEEPLPILNALDRLKNYNKEDIDLEKNDGMYCSNYSPQPTGGELESDLNPIFEQMFKELQESTPNNTNDLFDLSMTDSSLPPGVTANISSRQKLKAIVNTAFALSDRIGHDGIEKLESTLVEFNKWCSSKLERKDEEEADTALNPDKRTHAYMSQESYTGSAKRVYNTYHM